MCNSDTDMTHDEMQKSETEEVSMPSENGKIGYPVVSGFYR